MPHAEWKMQKASKNWLFVALDGICSNDFITGLRKLHELQLHMADKGFIPAVA